MQANFTQRISGIISFLLLASLFFIYFLSLQDILPAVKLSNKYCYPLIISEILVRKISIMKKGKKKKKKS